MFSQESDMIKTIRLIEGLKADLINGVGDLYKALAENNAQKGKEMLALLVVNCYVLGKRLGINFSDLDEAVRNRVNDCSNRNGELETRFGDFSKLARYLQQKR